MLSVEIKLLSGTYRADPSGDALTGHPVGEWPPSPARFLASMIAAGGSSRRNDADLTALAAAAPPIIYADPAPYQQTLCERYVVQNERTKGTHMEYVARKGTLVRPGVRTTPRDKTVVFCYPDFSPDDDMMESLRYRAARIGYLGCADSPVEVTVEQTDSHPARPAYVPDPDGTVIVNTHKAGHVEVWCHAYDSWVKYGVNRRRFQRLQHQTAYKPPQDSDMLLTSPGKVVAWLRFADAVSGRRAAEVSHRFKRAVRYHYHKKYDTAPPEWFHGHNIAHQKEWQLARFIPLPNVGYSQSDGRIHGVALWVPDNVEDIETRRVGAAARSVTYLTGITNEVHIAYQNRSRTDVWATNPKRWQGPSRQWATVFPAVSDRYVPVSTLNASDVSRWCRQSGLPEPVLVRVGRMPHIPGGVQMARSETSRPGHMQNRPWTHVEMLFQEKLSGPVVIGAARSYGLGLCAPIRPETVQTVSEGM